MISKIYSFQCEANQFLYGLGKGHQQYISYSWKPKITYLILLIFLA